MARLSRVSRPLATSERRGPMVAMAAGLFGLSFATALFTLSIFKLLSFFIMPSLFFDMLFIGFPLGAFAAARWLPAGRGALLRSLWALQAVMAASVGCCLLAKRFDYLRAHLFDIDLGRLIGQIAVFVGLFLPFFAAYGMSEYLGYQYGRSRLGGRMRLVYALALFGAAAAYLFLRVALPPLGMARVQLLAFLGVAGAIAAFGAGTSARAAAGLEALALGLALLVPGLEGRFLSLYKGRGELSTYDFQANRGCRPVYQRWGRYSLCEILAARGRRSITDSTTTCSSGSTAPGWASPARAWGRSRSSGPGPASRSRSSGRAGGVR